MPPPWLARFVEDVRVTSYDGPRQIARLPDGRTNLIFRMLDGERGGDLTVSGPRTRALFKTTTGVARAIAIGLKPGWAAQLFGVSAATLTDRIVHLHDIWGDDGGDLCDQLVATPAVPEMLERISDVLARRTAQIVESASARLARRAVRLLETADVRVGSVAQQLGVTPRHLRRAFIQSVGIGPKDFARTVRLHRAVRHATPAADWGRIAADAGYYDQAHLIVEFRELVGLTPGAFVKRATAGV